MNSDYIKSIFEKVQTDSAEFVAQTISVLPKIVLAIIVVLLTRTIARLVRRGITKLGSRTLKSLSLQTLLVQTSYVGTWVAGILLASIIAFPGVNFGDLVALLGLGSVAIGFAFQDIFKNFLSGVLLLLQEPFSLGDQIIIDGYEGTVSEIALRSTQIRTYRGELVVIPNSVVFMSPIQVMTGKPQRRTDLAIGVDYNTPLQDAIKTLYEAANSIEEIRSTPAVEVDIVSFGDSSIDLMVRYWTNSEQKSVRRVKTQVMMALKQACDAADISIPYPIRTVYHFDQEKYNDYQSLTSAEAEPQDTENNGAEAQEV
ncbi:MAG: mechanosensitive ion channel family protein [Cyanobacteria bacterium J06581_3]